ncbi:Peptidase M15A, C-terminal [uncultured Caudovirales phage]|uniref:Peptidase M15A, C-terminal n=1 Tax=uncultured Caudovirales phage TaxID=2100421 RepID=A0A6J7WE23_9CAUD|nr:Peptidase M15A, C-terminal [uncultured Caudovirales phage]
MKLTAHFDLSEFTRSESAKREGLDNTPTPEHLENIKILCEKVLEPIRLRFGSINISSGYRGKLLNHFIGGAVNSDHCVGRAADIDMDDIGTGVTNTEIFNYIKDNLDYDQLIWEFGNKEKPDWVHVGYRLNENRKQTLRATKVNGKSHYAPY